MQILDGFYPDIAISRVSANNVNFLEIFIDTPKGCINRKPTFLKIQDDFVALELEFSGFDELKRGADNQDYLSGYVYLKTNGEKKTLLCEPYIKLTQKHSLKRKKISTTLNIINLSQEIRSIWQEAFNDAYDQILHKSSNQTGKPQKGQDPHITNNIQSLISLGKDAGAFGKLIKSSCFLLLVLLISYVGLTVYNKSLEVESARSVQKSLNPTTLAKNQNEIVNQTFKEMGIDRTKLTSDLSCFQDTE